MLICTGGKHTGEIKLSGYPKEQASFARVSGYVEQFDIVNFQHASFNTPKKGFLTKLSLAESSMGQTAS